MAGLAATSLLDSVPDREDKDAKRNHRFPLGTGWPDDASDASVWHCWPQLSGRQLGKAERKGGAMADGGWD